MAFYGYRYENDLTLRGQRQAPLFGWVMLCLIIGLNLYRADRQDWITPLVYCVGALVGIVLLIPKINKPMWLRTMRKRVDVPENANLFGMRTIEPDDEKIHLIADKSETTLQWDAIVKYAELDGHFLLFVGADQACIIPKRAMTETQIDELRQLLNNKIKN
jgi:hypothetical protein